MYCTICRKTVKHNVKLHIAHHYKETKFHCKNAVKVSNTGHHLINMRKLLTRKNYYNVILAHVQKHTKVEMAWRIIAALAASKNWICSQFSKHFCSRGNLKRHQNLHCKQGKDKECNVYLYCMPSNQTFQM